MSDIEMTNFQILTTEYTTYGYVRRYIRDGYYYVVFYKDDTKREVDSEKLVHITRMENFNFK